MFAEFAYITIKQKFVSSVQIKKKYNFSIQCQLNTQYISIGQYWHSNQQIPIIGRFADYRCIPNFQ